MNRGDPASWTRKDLWAPWIFGAFLLFLGLLIWEWFPPGIWHDDGVYVLLGRAIARGEGLRYVGVSGEYLAPKFPPLYPLALATVWKVSPDFPDNITLLAGVNLLFLAVAGGLFLAYARRVFQMPSFLALGCAAVAWLSPGLWRVTMVPLSEPLFLLLLVASLWAAFTLEREGGVGTCVLFFLVAEALFLTRTTGVVVILGVVLGLLLTRRFRASSWVLLGGIAITLPWAFWSRWASRDIPGPLMDILGPYGSWLTGEVTRDPGAYLAFLPANALSLLARILSLLLPGVTGGALWLGILLLPVLALGFWSLGKKSPTLPLTVILGLGVLLLWPFGDIRLLLPFQPFLILGLIQGFRVLLTGEVRAWGGHGPSFLLGGAWVALFLTVSLLRLGSGWVGENYRVRSEGLVQAARAIRDHTPEDGVVGAPELWSGIFLFTGREVSPSAPFRPLADSGKVWGDPREQYRLWLAAGLTHILVEHGGEIHGEALDRVDALCPPGTIQLLDARPGQFLVQLNWDRECQARVLGPDRQD